MAISSWTVGGVRIIRNVQRLLPGQSDEILRRTFAVPGDAPFYLSVMQELVREPDRATIAPYFRPQAPREEIADDLVQTWVGSGFGPADVEVVGLLIDARIEIPWEPLIARISADLVVPTSPLAQAAIGVQMFLALQHVDQRAAEALANLAATGHLLHYLHSLQSGDTAKALFAFAHARAVPALDPQSHFGNSATALVHLRQEWHSPGDEQPVAEAFAHLVVQHNAADTVFAVSTQSPDQKPFMILVLKALCADDRCFEALTPAQLVTNNGLLFEALQQGAYYSFMQKAARESGLRSYLISRGFDAALSEIYGEVLDVAGGVDEEQFRLFVATGLRSVPWKQWYQALVDGGDLLRLLVAARRLNLDLDVGASLVDGMKQYTVSLLDGEAGLAKDTADAFADVLTVLGTGSVRLLLSSVADRFVAAGAKVDPFLRVYEDAMLENVDILVAHAEKLVENVFARLLDSADDGRLKWMADVLEVRPALVSERIPTVRDLLFERVRRALKSEISDVAQAQLHRVVSILGIPVAAPEADAIKVECTNGAEADGGTPGSSADPTE
jgi:hypothetical protein